MTIHNTDAIVALGIGLSAGLELVVMAVRWWRRKCPPPDAVTLAHRIARLVREGRGAEAAKLVQSIATREPAREMVQR